MAEVSTAQLPGHKSRLVLPARFFPHSLIAICSFLGAFVIFEPAPYELLLVFAMAVFLLFGMRLSAISVRLTTLFVLYNLGGLLAMFTMADVRGAPLYLAVSLFLGLTSVFWCAVVEADMTRLRTIMRACVAGAAISATLGIAGYFDLFTGASLFTRYGRAMGAFQDPNVFGPFLVLPIIYLIYGIIYRDGRLFAVRSVLLLILMAGLFLSFSRAAWGCLALSGLLFGFVVLAIEQDAGKRARLLLGAAAGLVLATILLSVALQFDAVYSTFEVRARLVQDYDGARVGRFARHLIGFQWALENPLGIGPLEFGHRLGEDMHNIWIKSLMAYGWLGFIAYLIVTLVTLFGGAQLLGRKRPWQPFLLCLWPVYTAHILMAWVIDIDHWRHVYLLTGLIWGCMALELRHQHTLRTT